MFVIEAFVFDNILRLIVFSPRVLIFFVSHGPFHFGQLAPIFVNIRNSSIHFILTEYQSWYILLGISHYNFQFLTIGVLLHLNSLPARLSKQNLGTCRNLNFNVLLQVIFELFQNINEKDDIKAEVWILIFYSN